MKYKFIGEKELEIGGWGIVQPGEEFEINNPAFDDIFNSPYFEKIEETKQEEIVVEEIKEEEL